VPRASCTCQSTGTAATALAVIEARLAVKNAPSEANSSTAIATPTICPIMRPVRRRSNPASHVTLGTPTPPPAGRRRA
jgi:hypothetical protein